MVIHPNELYIIKLYKSMKLDKRYEIINISITNLINMFNDCYL